VRGTKRVLMEFQSLARAVADGVAPCRDLVLPDERNVCVWRFKLSHFDDDLPGGRALNSDLARLAAEYGQDHLLCEVSFPSDYPARPFALRLVSPRCAWYTGHVTAGGSVCIEALTQTGSRNSWQPDFCVSGLLPLVKQNMIDVDEVMVRTATGPGGRAGPLRIDFERRWHTSAKTPVVPYSEAEAAAAFARTEAHHKANGW
jgi:ubiquitin-conjugating enzyme E2 Q